MLREITAWSARKVPLATASRISGLVACETTAESAQSPLLPTSGDWSWNPLALYGPASSAVGKAGSLEAEDAVLVRNQGDRAGQGPNLYGVLGGPRAHMEGFNYSPGGSLAGNGAWVNAYSLITVGSGSMTYFGLTDTAPPGHEAAVAANPVGTLGAVVSGAAGVVAHVCALWAEMLPALSYAATV